eukprot:m.24289 g.24289  ORF g.24289 m.24289 type:complete len:106 (-) comp3994_c0_seq1:6-323(-)
MRAGAMAVPARVSSGQSTQLVVVEVSLYFIPWPSGISAASLNLAVVGNGGNNNTNGGTGSVGTSPAVAGAPNTGGGGGGSGVSGTSQGLGGNGGSGVIVLRWCEV